LYAT
jgi:hypothetical protein